MSDWTIRIPYRRRCDDLVAIANLCRHLEGDERVVTRAVVLKARLEGLKTAGELLDALESAEPERRRALIDDARAELGLKSTAKIDADDRWDAMVRRLSALAELDVQPPGLLQRSHQRAGPADRGVLQVLVLPGAPGSRARGMG
jgi:hypothetical protein